MSGSVVLGVERLGAQWKTLDPFLFCVHHDDAYPAGNERMGPAASLEGRNLGRDFEIRDGWRMYHGQVVPGFPKHPHRGFETVTLARRGYIDHSDSLGATARFGHGAAQWMTAGEGIVHAEMFPLVKRDAPNPTELFQIWINLPAHNKLVKPYFTMFWGRGIPRHTLRDEAGRSTEVVTVAGPLDGAPPPSPPPDSWAARPENEVAIWTIRMQPGATWTMPPASPGVNRTIYYFRGRTLQIGDQELSRGLMAQLRPDVPGTLRNGSQESEILMLQGRPIREPVARYGPFVMNTPEEIRQAYDDYHRTGFGGWPWGDAAPVHPRDRTPFAVHADGRMEREG